MTLILSQLPALKKTLFPKERCPADIQMLQGGSILSPRRPKNHSCGTPAELHREWSATADVTACGYASGPSADGLKQCGEPTCKFKSQLVISVHQYSCGRSINGFVVGSKTLLVAHKNHSIEHNRIISNHSRTPLSYEDVIQQHHSFGSTAVVQFRRSRGGRVSLLKTKKLSTTCSVIVITLSAFSWHDNIPAAVARLLT